MEIPVVVQHRHVHLCEHDAQILFGTDNLTSSRMIYQRDQYIFSRKVSRHGSKGSFEDVCVIGPVRDQTQVEISSSDACAIGLLAPLRVSGDLERSGTVLLKTDLGEIRAKSSTIIPMRHLHLPLSLAEELGLSHHDTVSLTLKEYPEIVFDHVVIRIHPAFLPAFHLTKDEAASEWIHTGDHVIL